MGFYIDITLIPSVEVSLSFLWRKVYQQVHCGLVGFMNGAAESEIGVSFPDYRTAKSDDGEMLLGRRFRLYSKKKEALEALNVTCLFARLSDYVHVTSIKMLPNHIRGYYRFKRVQSKSNTERLARRKAKRENITYEQALMLISKRKNVFKKSPFINLASISTGHNFPLIISRETVEAEIPGNYNSYGLSSNTTVPIF